MRECITKNQALRILVVSMICAADIAFAAGCIFLRQSRGILLSVRNASSDMTGIFFQSVMTSGASIVILIITAIVLREKFADAMYLKLKSRKQAVATALLAATALIMAMAAIKLKGDRTTILYSLLYYFLFIAFFEEFVVRGVCVYILRSFSSGVRYLAPNILFALMHIFSYADWQPLTIGYVISFFTGSFAGLVIVGCLLLFIKEKTGTLWIPVLIHGIMDFAVVFSY